jgi:hypothetical protein
MADHVQIARREINRLGRIQIPRDRQRLQENLRHDDRAAEVEDDSAIVELGQRRSKTSEIPVARVADCGSVRRGMLMDDLGAECRVNGAGNTESLSREQE